MRAVLMGLGLLLAGCDDTPPATPNGSFDLARGKSLYQRDCLLCHGETGTGGAMGAALEDIPDLAASRQTVVEMADVILAGQGRMRGWSGMLDRSEALDIASYIKVELLVAD